MNEKRMLDLLGNVNEKYIDEANPFNRKQKKIRIQTMAAACLCLLIIGTVGVSYYRQNAVGDKYYAINIEEISAIYEGELLAENISYEEATDTNMLLCYAGTGLPVDADGWKTLSVSANYEEYDMTLNCAFNGETFDVEEEKVTDTIQYGDTIVYICKAEAVAEYDLAYYAVFEYQNVYYELFTYSDDRECIYDILQAVLGETNKDDNESESKQRLKDVLGYKDYYVKVEQNMPGFMIQKYYTDAEGVETCIAEAFGYVVPGPEVYSKDLDGDGINELICNCMAGTGAERVYVYRNNNGLIERGRLSYDLWDDTLFQGITNRGSSYVQEKYISETDTFKITYPTETETACVIVEDMNWIIFEEFVEENKRK